MGAKKQYTGDISSFEKKLGRVMERLGVETYQSDWTQSKSGSSCFVEMRYGGSTYRFENSTEKSREAGRNLTYVSDLFAAVVYSLEGLARAVEQGIFTLDMLLTGIPALPEPKQTVPACFAALGFAEMPGSAAEITKQYRRMAQVMHPDKGGDEAAFVTLKKNYDECLSIFSED